LPFPKTELSHGLPRGFASEDNEKIQDADYASIFPCPILNAEAYMPFAFTIFAIYDLRNRQTLVLGRIYSGNSEIACATQSGFDVARRNFRDFPLFFMKEMVMKFRQQTKKRLFGQGMVEYIIIVAVVALGSIAVYTAFGDVLRGQVATAAGALNGETGNGRSASNTAATTAKSNNTVKKDLKNYDQQ
jgi:Flp pilus assembly pilin Flp